MTFILTLIVKPFNFRFCLQTGSAWQGGIVSKPAPPLSPVSSSVNEEFGPGSFLGSPPKILKP